MTTTELTQRIKSAGLHPIPVEGDVEASGLTFSGSLEDFFAATKALGAGAIFLFASKLEKEQFHYDSDYIGDFNDEVSSDESPEDAESFDLTIALPSLSNFRKYVGQESQFRLMAKTSVADLSLYLAEDWWSSFEEHRDKAIQKVNDDRDAIREKMERQQLKRDAELLAKVRSLINDPEFCRIPTQRGMKTYVLEKFPEMEDVDENSLIIEIQKLSDKAQAKRRKR